jgi:DNA primase
MTIGHVHLTPQLVAAVRQAVDVVAIAEEHTKLTKRGKSTTGLCPLHREKSPSFSVDPERGLFYCFGCGQGGDAIKLHMLLSGDDFPAAIEGLARRFGVPLPTAGARRGPGERDLESVLAEAAEWFARQLERSDEPRRYLEKRGISAELAKRYGVGYAPPGWDNLKKALAPRTPEAVLEAAGLLTPNEKRPGERYDRFRHRLMFPIKSAAGAFVGFGGRALGVDDKPKYLNTPETERFRKGTLLYGLDQAKRPIREQGRAVLVEGYFDVLGAVAAGVEGAVASMGTSLTAEQAQLLGRYCEEVVVGYDGDAAGVEASRRALGILLPVGVAVRRLQLPPGDDPDSLRMRDGGEALLRLVAAAPDAVEHELARLLPSAPPTDPQTQAKLAAPVVELLTPVKDPILRWAYGRRAAERMGVPFELLAPRLGPGPASVRRGPAPRAAAAQPGGRDPGRDLEEGALRLLLAMLPGGTSPQPGALPLRAELPPFDAFWDGACRNVYRTFCVLYDEREGEAPSLDALREKLETNEGGASFDLVARLVIQGPGDPGEAAVTAGKSRVESYADRLRVRLGELHQRWREQRNRQLSREISEAQRAGDEGRLFSLLEEKAVVSRAVHAAADRKPAAVRAATPKPLMTS